MKTCLPYITDVCNLMQYSYLFVRPSVIHLSLPSNGLIICSGIGWILAANQTMMMHISIQLAMFICKDVLLHHNVKSTYEVIHAGWNCVITVYSLTDMISVLTQPLSSCVGASELQSLLLVIHIHAFHVLAYFPLKPADLCHHVVMIFFCMPFAFAFECGLLTQYCAFFICGLPGVFTYGAIAASRNDLISKDCSREINSVVNSYVRCPFAVIGGYIGALNSYNLLGLIPSLLIVLNGIYYNSDSIMARCKSHSTNIQRTSST